MKDYIGSQLRKIRKNANAQSTGEFTQKKVSVRLNKAQSWVSNIETQTKDVDYTIDELVKYLNLFNMGQLGEIQGDNSSLTGILRKQLDEIDDTISCLLWRLSVGSRNGDNSPNSVLKLGSMLSLLRDLKISLLPSLEKCERELNDGTMSSDKPVGDVLLDRLYGFLGVSDEKDHDLVSVCGIIDVPRALIKNSVDRLLGRL